MSRSVRSNNFHATIARAPTTEMVIGHPSTSLTRCDHN
jgi:hypothetical protein